MSTIAYVFSYTGQFKPGTGGQHLQMPNGIIADVGYTMPRSYYISRCAASWRSGSLAAGNLVITITIDNVDTALTLTITSTDVANGYKVGSAASVIDIATNEHLGCYAEAADASDYLEDLIVSVECDTAAETASDSDVLANIVVTTADLQKIRPDITQFLMAGETDFAGKIDQAKKEVYAEIKLQELQNYTDYTNADLDTLLAKIKDLPKEQCLKQRLKYMVVGMILQDNRLFNEAEVYTSNGKAMPLRYYIDDDADAVVDDSEKKINIEVKFGR